MEFSTDYDYKSPSAHKVLLETILEKMRTYLDAIKQDSFRKEDRIPTLNLIKTRFDQAQGWMVNVVKRLLQVGMSTDAMGLENSFAEFAKDYCKLRLELEGGVYVGGGDDLSMEMIVPVPIWKLEGDGDNNCEQLDTDTLEQPLTSLLKPPLEPHDPQAMPLRVIKKELEDIKEEVPPTDHFFSFSYESLTSPSPNGPLLESPVPLSSVKVEMDIKKELDMPLLDDGPEFNGYSVDMFVRKSDEELETAAMEAAAQSVLNDKKAYSKELY